MKTKRIFIALLALILAVPMFASCNKDAKKGNTIKVSIYVRDFTGTDAEGTPIMLAPDYEIAVEEGKTITAIDLLKTVAAERNLAFNLMNEDSTLGSITDNSGVVYKYESKKNTDGTYTTKSWDFVVKAAGAAEYKVPLDATKNSMEPSDYVLQNGDSIMFKLVTDKIVATES